MKGNILHCFYHVSILPNNSLAVSKFPHAESGSVFPLYSRSLLAISPYYSIATNQAGRKINYAIETHLANFGAYHHF